MHVADTGAHRGIKTDAVKFNFPFGTETSLHTLLCAGKVCVIIVTREGAGSTTLLPLLASSTVSWK